jgi:hypothetical protein
MTETEIAIEETKTQPESRTARFAQWPDEVQHLSFNYYIGICGWCDCTRLCNDCMALGLIVIVINPTIVWIISPMPGNFATVAWTIVQVFATISCTISWIVTVTLWTSFCNAHGEHFLQ